MKSFRKACILAAFLAALSVFTSEADAQTMSISPSTQSVSLYSMSTATVNVSISSVTNLYGYQHDILYSSSFLNVTSLASVTQGAFLKSGGASTFFINGSLSPGWIRNTACTRLNTSTGVSGSGNLTRITLSLNLGVVPPINTYVRLVNTKLSNINSQAIPHSVVNGTINIYECLSGETKACGSNIGVCRSGTQNCLPGNTWNTTCGGTFIPPDPPERCDGLDNDCDGQADENVTGSGNLSRSCSLYHYGICAAGNEVCNGAQYAGCPSPQAEICYDGIDQDCDNSDSTCRGDVNQNGCIDITDLSIVALDFGKTSGFADPRSDIDANGVVDIFDLVYVGKDFGVGCT